MPLLISLPVGCRCLKKEIKNSRWTASSCVCWCWRQFSPLSICPRIRPNPPRRHYLLNGRANRKLARASLCCCCCCAMRIYDFVPRHQICLFEFFILGVALASALIWRGSDDDDFNLDATLRQTQDAAAA